jgi:hypothetical protein
MGHLKYIVLTAGFLLFSISLDAQKNTFLISSGYGQYQGFSLGVGYFYSENTNLAISLGSHLGLSPFENREHLNITLENDFHFGNKNRSGTKPWFFGQQVMYWINNSETVRWKIVSIAPTIGRVFAITDKVGISFEIAPVLNFMVDVERDPTDPIVTTILPLFYNYRAQIAYMF